MAAIIEALRQFKDEGRHVLVKDHIRPAMSYLNAVGGSVVIIVAQLSRQKSKIFIMN